MSPSFHFKQFAISDTSCAMKTGTDAVLLGAWTNGKPKRILDIGTGSGIIAIMLAQKTDAVIDAIDIDSDSIRQARENAANCKWSNRIKVIHTSFQDFRKTQNTRYNLIVTNPPYFTDALKAPDAKRNTARHNNTLPFDELLTGVKHLLEDDGTFNIILPYNESIAFKEKALINNFYCLNTLSVKPKSGKPINRVLMQFAFHKEQNLQHDELTIRNEDNTFTNEYIKLTADYYLNF